MKTRILLHLSSCNGAGHGERQIEIVGQADNSENHIVDFAVKNYTGTEICLHMGLINNSGYPNIPTIWFKKGETREPIHAGFHGATKNFGDWTRIADGGIVPDQLLVLHDFVPKRKSY